MRVYIVLTFNTFKDLISTDAFDTFDGALSRFDEICKETILDGSDDDEYEIYIRNIEQQRLYAYGYNGYICYMEDVPIETVAEQNGGDDE